MELPSFRGEILRNEPLSRHTSYRIGGAADLLVYPADRDDLVMLLKELSKQGLRYFTLGSGTNLLVKDGGFRGVIISLRKMAVIKIEREYRSIGGAFAVVYAEAGTLLSRTLTYAAEEGLTGLEFAAGIPGTIGGAICMNAGTAAGEIGDVIESVTLMSPGGEPLSKGRDEMGFGYRTSSVPSGYLVLDTKLILRRDEKSRVQAKIRELLGKRAQRQPLGLPNAGSVFKNPYEESAGKIIESVGLKGKTVGDAQVSEKHANFIVNRGRATAADVLALMQIVQKKVLDVRGIRLEPEVKIIGED